MLVIVYVSCATWRTIREIWVGVQGAKATWCCRAISPTTKKNIRMVGDGQIESLDAPTHPLDFYEGHNYLSKNVSNGLRQRGQSKVWI